MPKSNNNIQSECGCLAIHQEVVTKVSQEMPEEEAMLEAAEFFRLFGDSTRIKILTALSRAEMCGCDLCSILNMSQSAISHQLRLLKQARLVRSRRSGKIVYFRLDDHHIGEILRIGMAHAAET